MELLHSLVCGDDFICNASRLPGSIWFLIFISLAILMSQLYPNLNSVAPRSLIGSIAAVVYFTILWTVSISKNKLDGVSHNPLMSASSEATRIRNVINALGIIAISFRGHNVVLEIQVMQHKDDEFVYTINLLKLKDLFLYKCDRELCLHVHKIHPNTVCGKQS